MRLSFLCVLVCCFIKLSAQSDSNSFIKEICVVQSKPEFIGGDRALFEFIKKNFRIPKNLVVERRTWLVYTVDTLGNLSNFIIKKSSGSISFDKESMRVIKLMSKGMWCPVYENGRKIKVSYYLPVRLKYIMSSEKRIEPLVD